MQPPLMYVGLWDRARDATALLSAVCDHFASHGARVERSGNDGARISSVVSLPSHEAGVYVVPPANGQGSMVHLVFSIDPID